MFGTDEFGNTRLLSIAFVILFAALALAVLATSQGLWPLPGQSVTLTPPER